MNNNEAITLLQDAADRGDAMLEMAQLAPTDARAIARLLKEQDELLHKKQKDVDRLCNEISEWKQKYHNKLLKEQEAKRDYEASVEMAEYCERYEQTYNPEDGSM